MIRSYPDNKQSRLRLFAGVILLALTALLTYAHTLEAPFLFDDIPNITQNPHIRMTEPSLERIIGATRGPCPFRPVANFSFALNYYFSGYDTTGYHLTNITIHLAIAVLLFLIAGPTLQLAGVRRGAIPELAAAAWLIHPLNAQSVTYIIQRMNSLATLFFMLGLYLYIQARLTRQNGRGDKVKRLLLFCGCAVSGLLAVFSKEIAATLPVCIFMYEWFFFRNLDSAWLKTRIKWIVLVVAVFLSIAMLYLKGDPIGGILASYDKQPFTPLQRLLTEPRVIVYYLSLLFFPHPSRLNVDCDFPLSVSSLGPAGSGLAMAAIAALLAAAFYKPGRHRLLSFSILWFLGNLVIESSVIGLAIIFQHRTYLPFLFPVLLITTLLLRRLPRHAAVIGFGLVMITGGVWTYQYNALWTDALDFWRDCAGKSPRKARPALGVGMAFQKHDQPEKALEWFQKAARLEPDYDEAYTNIGGILVNLGRPAAALPYMEKAISLAPDNHEAYSNLGSAMQHLQRLDEAIVYYQKALHIYPDYETAHNNLGAVLIKKGDLEGARYHIEWAIRINPEYDEAYNNLGLVMSQLGRIDEAIGYYEQALRLNPKNDTTHFNLGTAWFQRQDLERASQHLVQADRLNPGSVLVLNNLSTVLVMQGRYAEAIPFLTRLADLLPGNPIASYNLACAFALQGKKEAAVAELKKAVDMGYDRWDHLKSDPDLKNIHDTDYFQGLFPDREATILKN
ncbi:MAG: tetratricopeptide repeat protein [Thermodesulfobacteriota bacterium]